MYVGVEEEEGGEWGGGPARTALRTLRAEADCAYIGLHFYCFPFCHLWFCGNDLRSSHHIRQLFATMWWVHAAVSLNDVKTSSSATPCGSFCQPYLLWSLFPVAGAIHCNATPPSRGAAVGSHVCSGECMRSYLIGGTIYRSATTCVSCWLPCLL